jgi:hypothetical protein
MYATRQQEWKLNSVVYAWSVSCVRNSRTNVRTCMLSPRSVSAEEDRSRALDPKLAAHQHRVDRGSIERGTVSTEHMRAVSREAFATPWHFASLYVSVGDQVCVG